MKKRTVRTQFTPVRVPALASVTGCGDTVEVQNFSYGVKSPYDVATGHTSGK
jgi:hypothetical protein